MSTHRTSDPGPSECVPPLCERCFAPIDQHEPLVRMTHLRDTDPDGTLHRAHSYRHLYECMTPRPAPHQRPDTGDWDASRCIGKFRC